MTATDELRRLLDERGVEWTNPNSILRDDMTSWVANGFDYDAFEVPDGTLVLSAAHQDDLTPEQAIAATLGAGTCREVYLLMATDIGDGREEVLGVYATEEAATAAINENQFGYALHHVRKWEVDA